MGEKISISSTSGGTHTETAIHQIQEWIMKPVTNLPTTNIPTTGILWGSMATALVGATLADWQRKREEEVAREENFGDGRKGKKGKGGGDTGYHSKIQAKQMADIIRVNAEQATIALEQQRQENIAAMHAKRAAAIAALDRLEMANKAAMEKAAAIKAALLLSLPSNGTIGLVQSVKPPVTSLGYYDLATKSYVSPQIPTPIGKGGGWLASLASQIIENFPEIKINKRIKIDIPALLPLELPSSSPLGHFRVDIPVNINFKWADIKVAGRTIGDDILGPGLFFTGYLLTVAPGVVENAARGARKNEYMADLTIDTGSFIASELTGDGAGLLATALTAGVPAAAPFFGVVANFGGDMYAGTNYDQWIENNGGRQKVLDYYQ